MCKNGPRQPQDGGAYGKADLPKVWNRIPDGQWLGWLGQNHAVLASPSAGGARHGDPGPLPSLRSSVRRERSPAPCAVEQVVTRALHHRVLRPCGLGGLSAVLTGTIGCVFRDVG